MKKLIRYFKRRKILLNDRNYYISMSGCFVHPNLEIVIKPEDLYNMTEEQFDLICYK